MADDTVVVAGDRAAVDRIPAVPRVVAAKEDAPNPAARPCDTEGRTAGSDLTSILARQASGTVEVKSGERSRCGCVVEIASAWTPRGLTRTLGGARRCGHRYHGDDVVGRGDMSRSEKAPGSFSDRGRSSESRRRGNCRRREISRTCRRWLSVSRTPSRRRCRRAWRRSTRDIEDAAITARTASAPGSRA